MKFLISIVISAFLVLSMGMTTAMAASDVKAEGSKVHHKVVHDKGHVKHHRHHHGNYVRHHHHHHKACNLGCR